MAAPAIKFQLVTVPPLGNLVFAANRTKRSLDDLSELFEVYEQLFRAGMKEQFTRQGAWGNTGGWADLSEQYAKWKAKHFPGRPIGFLRGHLRQAMTGGSGYTAEIAKTEASFGMGGGPALAYGKYFSGGGRGPARPVITFPASFKRESEKSAQRWLMNVAQQAFAVPL